MCDDTFNRVDVAAFIKNLADPADELVYQEEDTGRRALDERDELLLCTVKQGVQLYLTAETGERVIDTLDDEDMEMEVLCQQDDWTCVVLPGIGLGWVTNNQILSTEYESIDRMGHESIVSIEWIFERLDELTNGVQFIPEQLQVFGSLLDHTGR